MINQKILIEFINHYHPTHTDIYFWKSSVDKNGNINWRNDVLYYDYTINYDISRLSGNGEVNKINLEKYLIQKRDNKINQLIILL